MQRKLLALVATVAMVLSMFTGIAFAATGPVNARYYDLQWTKDNEPTFSAITVKDNVINYYADFSLIPETTTPEEAGEVTAKWVGIGIAKPSIPGFDLDIAGYYYTLTREDGAVSSGYSGLDKFAGDVEGLEWGLNTNKYRTAKITVRWLNEQAQPVGLEETFTFNFIDTRLQQVSHPYVGSDAIYADFQVLEDGVPVDLEAYSFSVGGGDAQAGKKGETVAKVKLGSVQATGPVYVDVLRSNSRVSQLAGVSLEVSSLPYKVQNLQESVSAGEEVTLAPVFHYLEGGKVKEATSFDITYKGAGLKEKKITWKTTEDPVKVTPTETGTLVVTVTAKADVDGNLVTVGTDTVEIKVTGYNMTIEPKSVLVDKAGTVTIVLKDEDGNPINNADIEIGPSSFSNLSIKPNNGVYEIPYKASEDFVKIAATHTVTAKIPVVDYDPDNGEYTVEVEEVKGELLVIGEEVYTVFSSLTNDILAGRNTQITLQVKDGATVVFPAKVKVLNDKGEQVGTDIAPLRSGNNVVVNVPAFTKAGEYTIVVENSDQKKIGRLPVSVQLPVLKLSAEKVTNNVVSEFTVELLDPTSDNKPLEWLLSVKPAYGTIHSLKLADKTVFGSDAAGFYLGRLEKYELSALLTADYEAAKEAKKVDGLIFTATGDKAVTFDVVPVADAKLIADPATMAVNQKGNITLTLVDANEVPLVDYTVLQGTTEFTTDENGQFVYPVSRMSGNIEFVANLAKVKEDGEDVVKTVKATVKMTDDTVAPTVTYEEEVDTDKTTIVIADNVRLVRVRIDGEEIDLFGRNPYEHEVTLVAGPNEFFIEALDAEDNRFAETIVITYNAPVAEEVKLVVGENEYTSNGDTKTMEAAPYKVGDHTMIAARMLEAFGASFAWDDATKTATFTLDGKVVAVTEASTTATVDGEQVTMPVAPENVNGRIMVPLRFVSSNLGYHVHWVPGDIITITR